MLTPQAPRYAVPGLRTVELCERYLDRLAQVIEQAGKEGHVYFPLVRRFERELAEARDEEALRIRLRARAAKVMDRHDHARRRDGATHSSADQSERPID